MDKHNLSYLFRPNSSETLAPLWQLKWRQEITMGGKSAQVYILRRTAKPFEILLWLFFKFLSSGFWNCDLWEISAIVILLFNDEFYEFFEIWSFVKIIRPLFLKILIYWFIILFFGVF